MSERRPKMTGETVLKGRERPYSGLVLCPKKVAARGLKLVPVAPRVCWNEAFRIPT